MDIVVLEHATRVVLPLAAEDPFPGVLGIALGAPLLGTAVVLGTKLGVFGWLDPWILGATPTATLLLPLAWLVIRSRMRVVAIDLDAAGAHLRVAGGVWDLPAGSVLELARDRLRFGDLDVALAPLGFQDRDQLQAMLARVGLTVRLPR